MTRNGPGNIYASGVVAVIVAAAAMTPSSAGPAIEDVALASLPPDLRILVEASRPATVFSQPAPDDGTGRLVEAVRAALADLGFPTAQADRLWDAGLPEAFAGRVAILVEALLSCNDATQRAIAAAGGLPAIVEQVRTDPLGFDAEMFSEIQDCSAGAMRAVQDLELQILLDPPNLPTSHAGPSNMVNIWPVLVIDAGGDDAYHNDYMLIVELGGSDVYDNNAGSNMIDVRFAPTSSPFPGVDPIPHVPGVNDGDDDRSGFGESEGCAIALGSLLSGNCTTLAAALVDTAGNDQYGVFEPPVPGIDARCTRDVVVRRMVTNGVGFIGFGMLLDTVGSDRYNGKTGSNGAGHVFGVGVLADRRGNDVFLDVRNAQGFSLIGFLGLLRNEADADVYDFYMPSPLNPKAPNEQDGAGGVIDDTNLCDNLPRLLQGAGDATGVGLLLDEAGADRYRGGCTDDFIAPGDIGQAACSQGFGATAGLGILLDRAGSDSYSGVPGRGNHRTILNLKVDCCVVDPAVPEVQRELTQETFVDV